MFGFLKDTAGNIAVTTAVVAVPLCLCAGAAVDYTLMTQERGILQNSLDAATLAAGRELRTKTDEELKAIVDDYLKANLPQSRYNQISQVSYNIDRQNYQFKVTAEGEYPAAIMNLAGVPMLKYSTVAKVAGGGQELEVVLVLDSTFSMSADGKMDALKIAAKGFVDDMLGTAHTAARVKIGIVPFAQYVNVGLDNRNATWMDVPADSSQEVCQMVAPVISQSGCTNQTGFNDGVPYTYQTCSNVTYGPPVEQCSIQEVKWNGCAGSRDYPLNLTDASYGTRVPGAMNVSCPSRLTELSDNQTALKSEIDALVPSGQTYIPTGLAWGMRTLSSKAPFTQGTAPGGGAVPVNRAIILMSDGENQSSAELPGSHFHNGTDLAEADDWVEIACDNIKGEQVQVFTIGFGVTLSNNVLNLLQDCASATENFHHVITGSELDDAFAQVAADLTEIYLSE